MPLKHDFSEILEEKLKRLFKKDRRRYEILMKKIEQIVDSNEITIEHYKNLRYGLSDRKRVHIGKSFVLTFRYDRDKKFIVFLDFDHHDNIYKR
ncbi:MAG: addiction module toxin RelE [Candidatus Diapherotrites archaeon]|uniref:Addiction module toxin RelE n=1 Tax=Candidatus Iainarchaeum sp. TaxID=3101447 RepID=A0A938YX13_9ARCH|nr:addiction module toxin RelE [Candidatus Diapherotrites archaeon]